MVSLFVSSTARLPRLIMQFVEFVDMLLVELLCMLCLMNIGFEGVAFNSTELQLGMGESGWV